MNSTLPTGTEKLARVRSMFDTIAPKYDRTNKLLTFGLDVLWRKRSMRYLALPPRSVVADLACGTGDYCRLLKQHGHHAIGFDLSLGMLKHARTSATLVQADATQLPLPDASIDGITSGFSLRNIVELNDLYREMARVLRPGGRIVLLDAYRPDNPVLAAGHRVYFEKLVPRIGAAVSNADAYQYLPESLQYLPAPQQILDDIAAAGFRSVSRRTFSGGIVQMFTATKI